MGGISIAIAVAAFVVFTPCYKSITSLPVLLQYPVTTVFRILPSYIFFVAGVVLCDAYRWISYKTLLEKALLGFVAAFITVTLNLTFLLTLISLWIIIKGYTLMRNKIYN